MARRERIAILTSGGDAPGMNAAIRGIVRCASSEGIECFGVEDGYTGLINGNLRSLDSRSVSNTIQKGGTILCTSRCPEFLEYEYRNKAYNVLSAYNVDALVVIGGNGSFAGMNQFSKDFNFPCFGIPGTIDNDLSYTDFTLGFDTAVNTVVSAINNIRDTMTAHNRACIIEVMGRHCGDIALYSGLSGGAEIILVPEMKLDINGIVKKLQKYRIKGKNSSIIILAEGVCSCIDLKEKILAKDNSIEIRTVKLGYLQRGGTPSMFDRVFACRCAEKAIELIINKEYLSRVIGIKDNKIFDMDTDKALQLESKFDYELYNIAQKLSN